MQLSITTKYTLSGIAFGLAFPLVSWALDIYLSGLTLSPAVIVQIHQNNAIHYIVDLAPFILGTVFYFLGKAYQRALTRNYFSSLLAEDRTTESTLRFNIIISLVVVVTLSFVGTASWYMQHEMRLKAQAEIGDLLDTILATTEQATYFRLQEEQSHVFTWARTEDIVQATQALMPEQDSRQRLIASPAQATLRNWFEPIRETRGYQGFFIISLEGINLASTRGSNTGQVNILTQLHPEFLQKIWQGDTALSTPHHAHVPLLSPEGKLAEGLITIFVGAPIKDESGQIIAALTFRLDPHTSLSPILRQGRIGESGETYAFITEGEIITQSRFDQQINKYGIAFIGADGTVHLEVRDPGVNLTLGEQTDVPRSKQPFTRMAIRAMAGESGQDLEGYRDYRGVPVIGSWLWSDRLGFGMTTEIDVAEGYALLNFNRRIITISSFILGMLILGFVAFLLKYLDESRRSAQILIENEQSTRLLLNSTGEAIYGIDLNGECTFANHTCLEILGNQSEQELLGKNMHTLIHHTHNDGSPYPVEECKIFKAFKEGEGTHVDDEVLWRADGSSFPAEYRSFPMLLHGQIIGSVVSFTDISVQLEGEVRQRMVVTTMIDGLITIDEDGIIDSFNPAAEKMFGYSSEEIIGENITQLIPDSYRSQHTNGLERYIKTGESHILGVSGREIEGLRKDGSIFPLAITISEMFIGEKRLFSGVIRDITDRKVLEEEREQVAAELTQLIDTVNAPIFGIDVNGMINEWNQQAASLSGYSKAEVMELNLVQTLIPEEKREEVRMVLSKALKGEETVNYDFPICTKEGKRHEILLNASTRRDINGNITGVIGVGQDITELKVKEKALNQAQKMEAVGQLTGGIAHDFNNLLSIISGNLRFLQQDIGQSTVEINELFEDAMSAVDDGAELTQRLLGFSRSRSLRPEMKNVNDTIEKFTRFLSRTLGEGLELDIDLTDEDLFINVDPSQLENALLNLTINARDAMPNGGTITISATQYHHGDGDGDGDKYSSTLSEGDYIKVSVTDTGTGIAAKDLQHVYEPFFTTKEVGKGSGLGLSMVYGFVQQSNGACYIRSTPGKGTTVSMVFPEVMDDKPHGADIKDKNDLFISGSEVILIVEDEPRVRRVTIRDLKKLGYKTLEAENADMAKTIIESGEHIDLLFSDVLMPGEMDGHMLGIWTEENYPQIKIVLTSGFSKGKADVSRKKAHPFPMIRKPYTIEKLAKQIRTTLAE